MTDSHKKLFNTTNQDYGSFYLGRLQNGLSKPKEIAFELAINDQVRNERRHLTSIAYDIMFDKHNLYEIVTPDKKKYKPIVFRRHLKYIKSKVQTNEERRIVIKDALQAYSSFIECIYRNRSEENPQLSNTVLELVANELLLLSPDISTDELVENLVAITVPHQYLGMSTINPNQPYPGTESECGKTPGLLRLFNHFQTAKKIVNDSKQRFDSRAINSQFMEGIRYIYKPFSDGMPSRRI